MLQWGWKLERVGDVEGKASLSSPEDAAVSLPDFSQSSNASIDGLIPIQNCNSSDSLLPPHHGSTTKQGSTLPSIPSNIPNSLLALTP